MVIKIGFGTAPYKKIELRAEIEECLETSAPEINMSQKRKTDICQRTGIFEGQNDILIILVVFFPAALYPPKLGNDAE